ncbi:MAG TPA: polysaccharide pyruvyl transferase family protein [Candidatus Saccharimonadales bacterium]|nr:polysaccharide pyruvyl transferase family protein [Candidatus Saccharimonadales bacterium]
MTAAHMTQQKNNPTPRNVLITNVYSSDNKGDAALTSVLVKDIKRAFPSAAVRILSLESTRAGVFEDVPVQPAFMAYVLNSKKNPLLKLLYALYMVPATLGWALVYKALGWRLPLPNHLQQVVGAYVAADLIIGVGGGYIRSRKGLVQRLNIPLLLHGLLVGRFLGKTTALYSQSVGPFLGPLEEPMVAAVLRRMDLIILREDVSVALLKRLGVTKNVVRSVDSGFLLASDRTANVRATYNIAKDKLLLGVTVRKWLQGEAQVAYEKAVAGALDSAVQKLGAHVIFIPQVTAAKGDDDRQPSMRVQQYMKFASEATVVSDTPDHHDIKSMYNELDMLLGTRFHSVIFSLTSYVPVVAIEYEHKTSGIMHDLQLDDWVIKIEDVTTDRLIRMLRRLAGERAQYVQHLRRHLPPYVEQAHNTIQLVAQAYDAAR